MGGAGGQTMSKRNVAVVEYKAGNVRSVVNALAALGVQAEVTADPAKLAAASHVVFPGVGHAEAAMGDLRRTGLDEVLKGLRQPFLGICLGMQLLCEHTEEQDTTGLGLLPVRVARFPGGEKVPHMGWNSVEGLGGHPLFEGIRNGEDLYFVHSYAAALSPHTIATCRYGIAFSAALARGNFMGVQFHPEKSAEAGRRLLANFLAMEGPEASTP